jgi:hypothetical protein
MPIAYGEPTANPSTLTLPGSTTITLPMRADPPCRAGVRLSIAQGSVSFANGKKEWVPPDSPIDIGAGSDDYRFPINLVLDEGGPPAAMVYVNLAVQPLDAAGGPPVRTGKMIVIRPA